MSEQDSLYVAPIVAEIDEQVSGWRQGPVDPDVVAGCTVVAKRSMSASPVFDGQAIGEECRGDLIRAVTAVGGTGSGVPSSL
jgi:hypothetical protein